VFFQVSVRDPIDANVALTLANDLGALFTDKFLAEGQSYIALAEKLGDQGLALTVMAVGEVAGFWTIITPEKLSLSGDTAHQLAGVGFVMTSGFNHPKAPGLDDLDCPRTS
jgi:hypothetical protein